ncbi:Ig-like domain-containing protein [Vibrio sp. B1ASS3]|uniref:Ig-like domain-containing protein n=1 Tax=Vibrio sp. B1ASS3 TaxID=2751176 RepID=UPI001ABA341C|nr:Ig-like domain-containing protein [Vibrio sp. B1ASS3]
MIIKKNGKGSIVGFLSFALISGCNTDDANRDNVEAVEDVGVALAVRDGFVAIAPDASGFVDLTPYVVKGTNVDAKLQDVILEGANSNSCGDAKLNVEKLGFNTVLTSDSALCNYRYIVQGENGVDTSSESATLTVVASSAAESTLSPLSIAMVIDSASGMAKTSIKIDSELSAIGATYPAGFTLSSDYTLSGNGNVTVQPTIRTIEFETSEVGYSQIIYKLTDPIGSAHRFGVIDIAVSDSLNQAPIAEDSGVWKNTVAAGEDEIININHLVTSPDGDDYQLVYVNAFNANVESVAPSDLTNKEFRFQTLIAGEHDVSFVVSDHKGGFDSGMVKVKVVDPLTAKWKGIEYEGKFFTAPYTYQEAIDAGVVFSGGNYDSGYSVPIKVATFSFSEADNQCAKNGGLPSIVEITDLFTKGALEHQNWPLDKPYWVEDGNVYSLLDGSLGTATPGENYYSTCVQDPYVFTTALKAIAFSDGVDEALVMYSILDKSGLPVQGVKVKAEVDGSAVLKNDEITTSLEGTAIFRVTNSVTENVTLSINGFRNTLYFAGDTSDADFDSFIIVENGSVANGIYTNAIKVVLKDTITGLPVQNAKVTIYTNGTAKLVEDPSTLYTDTNGELIVHFTDTNVIVPTEVRASLDYGSLATTNKQEIFFVQPTLSDGVTMWHKPFNYNELMALGFDKIVMEHSIADTDEYHPRGFHFGLVAAADYETFCNDLDFGGYDDWSPMDVFTIEDTANWIVDTYGSGATWWTEFNWVGAGLSGKIGSDGFYTSSISGTTSRVGFKIKDKFNRYVFPNTGSFAMPMCGRKP